ncbi:hypothetical protein MY4824_002088 [Beauveria thailandica]
MPTINPEEPFEAKIEYLARDGAHERVKPYYLYMKYDAELAPTNTAADDRLLPIYNARNLDMPPRKMFSELGFTQLRLDCTLAAEEHWDAERVKDVLYPKYRSIAQSLFPDAARVEILEHAVRKRHPQWLSDGLERHQLKTNQPSDYVHIGKVTCPLSIQFPVLDTETSIWNPDMTASSAAKCSLKQFNIDTRNYSRFVVINLWKPIKGPVYDFPLSLCDRRTVDYASQTTPMDIVTHNYINENTRVYFDEKHKWYYWYGLEVNEVIAFIQADSAAENRAGVPHTAFRDPRNIGNEQLRESIEARVFIYFE